MPHYLYQGRVGVQHTQKGGGAVGMTQLVSVSITLARRRTVKPDAPLTAEYFSRATLDWYWTEKGASQTIVLTK